MGIQEVVGQCLFKKKKKEAHIYPCIMIYLLSEMTILTTFSQKVIPYNTHLTHTPHSAHLWQ